MGVLSVGAEPSDAPLSLLCCRHAFFSTVSLYLGLSIALGVFSIARSLAFQVLNIRWAL